MCLWPVVCCLLCVTAACHCCLSLLCVTAACHCFMSCVAGTQASLFSTVRNRSVSSAHLSWRMLPPIPAVRTSWCFSHPRILARPSKTCDRLQSPLLTCLVLWFVLWFVLWLCCGRYDAPVVTSISGGTSMPTLGGTVVTLAGNNFGLVSPLNVVNGTYGV